MELEKIRKKATEEARVWSDVGAWLEASLLRRIIQPIARV